MNTRSRSLAWDATTAIEALAAADTALWIWTPADDQMRFTGATRALGLGPLAPECSGAAFTAVAVPSDRSLEVVAEGVENAGLASLLLDAQCHYGQGFGYAPALPAQEAEVYLNESLADGSAPIKARSA